MIRHYLGVYLKILFSPSFHADGLVRTCELAYFLTVAIYVATEHSRSDFFYRLLVWLSLGLFVWNFLAALCFVAMLESGEAMRKWFQIPHVAYQTRRSPIKTPYTRDTPAEAGHYQWVRYWGCGCVMQSGIAYLTPLPPGHVPVAGWGHMFPNGMLVHFISDCPAWLDGEPWIDGWRKCRGG